MSATDELRRMLDERGVEHETDAHGAPVWCVGDSRAYLQEMGVGLGCALTLYPVTPAQAIVATLGSGTCHNVHEPPKGTTFWPSPHFKCSECGATHVSMEYVYFCPNCGRKVVDE